MSLVFESDLHTHTRYSHGKGSIEDNVKAAIGKGLKQIGISEHGPGNYGVGTPRKKFAEMKAEIIRLRRVYPNIEILFGIEANIIGPEGCLDIRPDEFEYFDFVCAGWHFGAADGMTPAGVIRTLGNFTRNTAEKASKKQLQRNTDMVVGTIERGGVMFLTHPGDRAPVDIMKVAEACARMGTLLEINTLHMSISPQTMEKLVTFRDVRFIVNSDAHSPSRVGDFGPAIDFINETGLDPARVVNAVKQTGMP